MLYVVELAALGREQIAEQPQLVAKLQGRRARRVGEKELGNADMVELKKKVR